MKVAIVIAARNEALVIEETLKSCAGYEVFVADDNSSDATAKIAARYGHVLCIKKQVGKGEATRKVCEFFHVLDRFDAFVMLDADSRLTATTIPEFTKALRPGVAAAVGKLQSSNRSLYAVWRTVQYTIIYRMYRRGMEVFNTIHILSGTCSIWRTEVVKQLDWQESPVEDMDMSYQIHRRKLGKLAYAAKAVVLTQEPTSLRDYTHQLTRWFRGYWLTTAKYKTPFGRQSLDFGQAVFLAEGAWTFARLLALPFLFLHFLPVWFVLAYVYDVCFLVVIVILSARLTRDFRPILFLPALLLLYFYDVVLNFVSFLSYRKLTTGLWVSPERQP